MLRSTAPTASYVVVVALPTVEGALVVVLPVMCLSLPHRGVAVAVVAVEEEAEVVVDVVVVRDTKECLLCQCQRN